MSPGAAALLDAWQAQSSIRRRGRGGKREKEGNRNSHSTERVHVREKKKAVIVQLHAQRRETMSNIQRDRSNVQSARNHARDDEHDWNG